MRPVHSQRLLREHGGFIDDSDDYGDELPHLLDLGGSTPHVVLPYSFDANDMRFFAGSFVPAADFSGYVVDAVDALLAERDAGLEDAADRGLHSCIIGRPRRIAGLDNVLAHVERLGTKVCGMTREGIAQHRLAATAQHRRLGRRPSSPKKKQL